ncbi:MAG: Glu-tRNA(Gln) amidotransferase subunit GatE [Candidatus Nanoarchaeia archaeon]
MKDYKALGFKSGIEIHQQLDTHKLYCNCPSIVRDTKHDIQVNRRLRPVAGERGEVDIAALYEQSKGNEFHYKCADTSSCLVELDEEPPTEVNKEALGVVLQVAKMLNMTIVDEVHVMRKIVVDGSNTSGFQRTALIGVNGWIETSKGKVGIESVCLEEESAQKGGTGEDFVEFKLDRLGVPLVEIATDASLQDPEHVQEAAQKLGMILRSTGKVKRGIGSIRQDVNVSVSGGSRVELKGFQELKSMVKVADAEVDRQLELIGKGEEIKKEVRTPELKSKYLRPMPGAARMYPETDVQTVRITKEMLSKIEIPELIEDKIQGMVDSFKIDKEVAGTLIKQNLSSFFSFSAKRYTGLKPTFIADVLLSCQKEVKKLGKNATPSQEDYSAVFKALNEGKISKESVYDVFASDKPVKDALGDFVLMGDAELESKLKEIVAANKDMPFNALIGKAMGQLRGKADGKKIVEKLKQLAS